MILTHGIRLMIRKLNTNGHLQKRNRKFIKALTIFKLLKRT